MKIAVLSGKGGTGKTLVSVNLTAVDDAYQYLDCDVEEPNGHLFFKAEPIQSRAVNVKIPVMDHEKCNRCRECVDFCAFNALAFIQNKVKVFDSICHSCGGCALLCKQNAINEVEKTIGIIETRREGIKQIKTGKLNIGEETGVPIIKAMLAETSKESHMIIDCPPGSSCMVMESIKDADYCILVAEPTTFGAHNLEMVHDLVKLFEKPHGVILNKDLGVPNKTESYCQAQGVDVLMRLPFDREVAFLSSNGEIISNHLERYQIAFRDTLRHIEEQINEAITRP